MAVSDKVLLHRGEGMSDVDSAVCVLQGLKPCL